MQRAAITSSFVTVSSRSLITKDFFETKTYRQPFRRSHSRTHFERVRHHTSFSGAEVSPPSSPSDCQDLLSCMQGVHLRFYPFQNFGVELSFPRWNFDFIALAGGRRSSWRLLFSVLFFPCFLHRFFLLLTIITIISIKLRILKGQIGILTVWLVD